MLPHALTPQAPPPAWIWILFAGCIAVSAFLFLPRVFRGSPTRVVLVTLALSWLPVQWLGFVLEGQRLWLPGDRSPGFFWGELIALPLTAVALRQLRMLHARAHRDQVPTADTLTWRVVALVLALVITAAPIIEAWQRSAVDPVLAPSSAWHVYLAGPLLAFFLLSQLPFLWEAPWLPSFRVVAAWTGLAFAGVATWWVLGQEVRSTFGW